MLSEVNKNFQMFFRIIRGYWELSEGHWVLSEGYWELSMVIGSYQGVLGVIRGYWELSMVIGSYQRVIGSQHVDFLCCY